MDKKIMIDCVNVAGCEYLYTNKYNDKCCGASIGGDSLCRPSEMICFRYVDQLKLQLQRKEQECKELKETLNKLSKGVILPMPEVEVINLTDCYKQTLEKIEEICEHYKNAPFHFEALYAKSSMDEIIDIINEV